VRNGITVPGGSVGVDVVVVVGVDAALVAGAEPTELAAADAVAAAVCPEPTGLLAGVQPDAMTAMTTAVSHPAHR
jgi:hypothetical protein